MKRWFWAHEGMLVVNMDHVTHIRFSHDGEHALIALDVLERIDDAEVRRRPHLEQQFLTLDGREQVDALRTWLGMEESKGR
jgi:hypothetical protein